MVKSRDIPYLLARCRTHRTLARSAASPETGLIYHQLVRNYQHLLLATRQARWRHFTLLSEQLAA